MRIDRIDAQCQVQGQFVGVVDTSCQDVHRIIFQDTFLLSVSSTYAKGLAIRTSVDVQIVIL